MLYNEEAVIMDDAEKLPALGALVHDYGVYYSSVSL